MPRVKRAVHSHKKRRAILKRAKSGKSHILTSKDRKRKRALRKSSLVHATNEKSIRRLLPYL